MVHNRAVAQGCGQSRYHVISSMESRIWNTLPSVIRCHYSRNARVDKTEPIHKVNQNRQQMR